MVATPRPFRSGPYFPYPPGSERPIFEPPLVPIDRNAPDIALLTPADQNALEAMRFQRQAAYAWTIDQRQR